MVCFDLILLYTANAVRYQECVYPAGASQVIRPRAGSIDSRMCTSNVSVKHDKDPSHRSEFVLVSCIEAYPSPKRKSYNVLKWYMAIIQQRRQCVNPKKQSPKSKLHEDSTQSGTDMYTEQCRKKVLYLYTSPSAPNRTKVLSPGEQILVPTTPPKHHRGKSIPVSVGPTDGLKSAVRDTPRRERDRPATGLTTTHFHHRGIHERSQQAELAIHALGDGPLAALVLAGDALGDGPEVLAMGGRLDAVFAAVAALVVGAGEDDDILRTGVVGVFRDPVFGRHVLVADDDAGDARDRVVAGGDAVGLVGLAGQEFGRGLVADARGAEGVLATMSAYG